MSERRVRFCAIFLEIRLGWLATSVEARDHFNDGNRSAKSQGDPRKVKGCRGAGASKLEGAAAGPVESVPQTSDRGQLL
jgi:hypothetical protein